MKYLALKFPYFGPFWRQLHAIIASMLPTKHTYSQFGEDRFFLEIYSKRNADMIDYVDIGANHPTRISNTYLIYRHGGRGITIEPNAEYIKLHKKYRPNDKAICIGCGMTPEVGVFYVSATPVLSGFTPTDGDSSALRVDLVPILPLDTVLSTVDNRDILLLSVDTEGFERAVLSGARNTLVKTRYICIESNDSKYLPELIVLLPNSFVFVKKYGCNYIYKNTRFNI